MKTFFSLLICSLLYAGSAAHAAPPLPRLAQIVAQFEAVAFGHEHGKPKTVVQKWDRAPALTFLRSGNYDLKPYLPAVRGYVGTIHELTGLSFQPAEEPADTTLQFGFYPRAAFRQLPRHLVAPDQYERFVSTSACLGIVLMDPSKQGRIRAGAIAIGTDIAEPLRQHCILEELVQILGLSNDACNYRPSLFCEEDFVKDMMPADRILLKTLYDKRLTAGMPRQQAMVLVRAIVAEQLPPQ